MCFPPSATGPQTLAERQASLENAHAAVAEKERKIAGLEVGWGE